MRIDTLGVQAFIAIADHASFSRADSLHVTQTALSRRVQNLEAFLGVKLIERTTRSVTLTRIGRDFLPQARRLLTDLASALVEIRESGKALRGDVTIACVPTVGVHYLPGIVREYARRYPTNRVRILDHSSSGVAAAVLRREAEFGINMQAPGHPELASIPLLQDRLVLVCRDDHPLARRRSLAWKAYSSVSRSSFPVMKVATGRISTWRSGATRSPASPLRGAAQLHCRRHGGERRRHRRSAGARRAGRRLSRPAHHRARPAGRFAHPGAALAHQGAPHARGAGALYDLLRDAKH